MALIRLTLSADITPLGETVTVTGNLSGLTTEGYMFFEEGIDFFTYTGITGNTFTGVGDLKFVHNQGESLVSFYGITASSLTASLELTTDSDPDGIARTLFTLFDNSISEYLRFRNYLRAVNNPVFCDDSLLEALIASVGISYKDFTSDIKKKRLLALLASMLLKAKGSVGAFTTLVYLTTGIHSTVMLRDEYVPFMLNSTYGFLGGPTAPFPLLSSTLALWEMAEGSGVFIVDSVNGIIGTMGTSLMWDTSAGCSIFDRDVTTNFYSVATNIIIPAPLTSPLTLHNKSSCSLKILLKGATTGSYPQTILDKGVYSLTRLSETLLEFRITNGTDTLVYQIIDGISVTTTTYLAFSFTESGLSVIKNNELLVYNYEDGFILKDLGSTLTLSSALFVFHGNIDMLELGDGTESVASMLMFGENLQRLNSTYTNSDENTYFYGTHTNANIVEVVLDDFTGAEGVLEYITSLGSLWLGVGELNINPAGNLPLLGNLGII